MIKKIKASLFEKIIFVFLGGFLFCDKK